MLTLKELITSLRVYPEMLETEKALKENKSLLLDGRPSKKKYLTAAELRENFKRVAYFQNDNGILSEVFNNGFAIYDNSDRKTVVNLSKYEIQIYHSNILCKNFFVELQDLEWPTALCIIGEERIWRNMEHPKSKGIVSSMGDYENEISAIKTFTAKFGTPESVYMRKEMNEKFYKLLRLYTDKNAEVYKLYHEYGYTESEIARMLGITPQAISQRLSKARKIARAALSEIF